MEGKKFKSTGRAPPQSSPAGYIVFRILCDVAQVGDMIGKSGRVIKQLQESTKSKIWVDNTPLDSLYRVITVSAHVGSTSRVKLGVSVLNASNREKEEQEQGVEVSRAQYALIRVFEALNVGFQTSRTVSCRLLMEGSHVVTVIGKGGELLERIWRETGCNVGIQTHDLPICVKPDDVMVKIEGNVSAVKKTLVSISSRMQACQPISMASKNHPVTVKTPLQASEDDIREVVLKILCSNESASAVITTLQSVRDASISVGDTLADCDERLITITASENTKDKNSPAQRAIVLVFNRLYEIATEKMLDRGHKSYIIARLVVRPNQIGCLLGKGGCIISEMRKKTGASIKVLEVEKNPKCISENDQVVEISGKLPCVKTAIYHVTGKLRNTATKSKVTFIPLPGKRITLVLKILCSTESAGGVIGKEGTIIRNLQIDTGASIFLGDALADCDECLITITASEDPEDKNSPAQRAIILVFSRIYETATEKVLGFGLRSSITARLVVCSNQITCLVGKGGCMVSKKQKRTGAFIKVLKVEQNPRCVTENNNQIVQISGEFSNVKEAISQVTSLLRENLTLNSFKPVDADPCIIPEDPIPNRVSPTARFAPNFGRWSTMDLNDTSHHSSQAPYRLWASPTPAAPRGVYDGSGKLSPTRDDLGIYSRHKSSNVTSTTVQFRVSENAVNSVFGDGQDGHNLLQNLREVSGARIIIVERYLGTSDRIISISGTPDQIQAAKDRLYPLFLR